MKPVEIEASWKAVLADQFDQPYWKKLREILRGEIAHGKTIFPHPKRIFAAFEACPWESVRVVILGQDPYPNPGQAQGLSFSVPTGAVLPPSLRHIFHEVSKDCALPLPTDGDLHRWARQGVLLLNASLTVEAHRPQSHANFGWYPFTDAVIQKISAEKSNIVFLLWGSFAQKKIPLIDSQKHLILTAPHPSPLSAHRGFFGCRHFSQTNKFLVQKGLPAIDWR